MNRDELGTKAAIFYDGVENGLCNLTKLTLAKTKDVITAAEFDFIKMEFHL
ncbi:MAG TPA: hypothetical protein VN372_03745 [Methanospirillum sp.]|nr:hypothetical protein [Methanospirillum sp.]